MDDSTFKLCGFPGCTRPISCRQLCHTHYVQAWQGRPLAPIRATSAHGMSYTPEYQAWKNIRKRCLNANTPYYLYYGGRGIEVRFESFEAFLEDIGPRPSSKHSVDRIDVEGHYEPGNIRWSTSEEQARNKRPRKRGRAA